MNHIILGAGGSIGTPLANILLREGESVKLLSRRAEPVKGAQSVCADALDRASLRASIESDSFVYFLVGLKYDTKVWREHWLAMMQNVVEACRYHNAKLLFFDNVYMYGRVQGNMTEQTPLRPCSKKGEVRALVAEYLMNEYTKGNIQAVIARAADFYGPFASSTSVLYLFTLKRLAEGKKAQYLVSSDTRHSYTYTLDAAEALYALTQDESAWNQVWHLPTKNPAPTGRELTAMTKEILGLTTATSTTVSRTMLRALGLFVPVLREVEEMMYQNEQDYIFDSTKFEQHFNFTPTDYSAGIRATLHHFHPNLVP